MAVTAENYTRKGPDITVVKFDGDPVEVLDWVTLQLPAGWSAGLVNYNRTITVEGPNGEQWSASKGQYFAKDSNGKLFKLTDDLLSAFYDLTV